MQSESARMTTSEQARFRINHPNSKPRSVKVVALDGPSEGIVKRLAQNLKLPLHLRLLVLGFTELFDQILRQFDALFAHGVVVAHGAHCQFHRSAPGRCQ